MEREKFIKKLFEKNYSLLIREAYRYNCDEEAAQDMVQETFLLAVLNHEQLAAHQNPDAWLSVTLRNCCFNYRRLVEKRASVSIEDLKETLLVEQPDFFWELLPSKLKDSERRILTMRFKDGLSFREIGERLGVSETACRVRVFRLITKCRKLLKK